MARPCGNSRMMLRRRFGQAAGVAGLCLLSGCGNQSTLTPDSHASQDISSLWWWMLAGSAVVFAVVLALLVFGLLRRQSLERSDRSPIGGGTWLVATGGLLAPAVVIVVLFAATLGTLPTTSAASKATSLTVDVTGRQWFWDVEYPGKSVRTANEV